MSQPMDLLTEVKPTSKFLTISIAYLGTKFVDELDEKLNNRIDVIRFDQLSDIEKHIEQQSFFTVPDFLLLEIGDEFGPLYSFIKRLKSDPTYSSISIILLGFKNNRTSLAATFAHEVSDIYCYPFNVANIEERLKFLLKFKLIGNKQVQLPPTATMQQYTYRLPFTKRVFDVLVSGTMLLILSPVLVLIAILIKLDSKGPVIYKSERAGTGYLIFNFYKFRSMKMNADKELAELSALNQYA